MTPLLLALALVLTQTPNPASQQFLKSKQIESIAILPVVGDSVPSTVREATAKTLTEVIRKRLPDVDLTDHAMTASTLERESRLEDFTSFLNLYVKTGTINTNALSRCGQVLNRHMLLVEVQEYTERGGSWLRGRSGQNTARVQYTLFAKDGSQVWQTIESLHRSQMTTTVAPMEEIMERVSERAIKALIEGKENKDVKQKRGGRVL